MWTSVRVLKCILVFTTIYLQNSASIQQRIEFAASRDGCGTRAAAGTTAAPAAWSRTARRRARPPKFQRAPQIRTYSVRTCWLMKCPRNLVSFISGTVYLYRVQSDHFLFWNELLECTIWIGATCESSSNLFLSESSSILFLQNSVHL